VTSHENEPEPNAAHRDSVNTATNTTTLSDSDIQPAHFSSAAGTAVPVQSLRQRRVHWDDDQEEREVSQELKISMYKDGDYEPTGSAEEDDPPTEDEPEDDEAPDTAEEMEVEDLELEEEKDAPKKRGKGGQKKGKQSVNGGRPMPIMVAEERSKCSYSLRVITHTPVGFVLRLLVTGTTGLSSVRDFPRNTTFTELQVAIRTFLGNESTNLEMSYSTSWAEKSIKRSLAIEEEWDGLMNLAFTHRKKVKEGEYHAKLFHLLNNQPKAKPGRGTVAQAKVGILLNNGSRLMKVAGHSRRITF